ncbi:carbohydrate ABC transporter permease [Paenibacillus sp. S150]|uniref:carbohydrate ABC transporter permease n=1 Tax=Paenibacillus sp. S150 TaxID=2749826 RepID=UPI001C577685|nr:sugar ABC transporter permease [Paenibacillus sp. S150]MBW4084259.1 sugar ABC transporter permease [Paenibacillus sp. S150]
MEVLGKKNILGKLVPYLLVAPIVIWIAVTIFFPLFNVIKESFYNTGFVGTKGSYVGFDNYKEAITSSAYWGAWTKSLIWVLGNSIAQTLLAFAIALLLNKPSRFANWARTWMIIPWVIPTIVVGIFWQWIFNGSYGIFNHVLKSLNLIDKPINLIGDNTWSLPVTIFINTWHWFPFMAVIVLAGLSTISHEIYEAADVDGASKWQQFWKVTFPSLGPITFALGVVGTLWSFNIFDTIYILTGGGPAGATTTVPVFIYQQAFESFQIGKASATSIITAFFLIIFVSVFIKYSTPKED